MARATGYYTRASARRLAAVGVALVAVVATVFIAGAATSTAAGTTAVPVVIDTDIFSSVDDVGALATAFALQQKGEARVIAIGLDTRTSRGKVTPESWKCTAAIAQFYNSAGVPIGSDGPPNGTAKNDPDWATSCAALASASTPSPDTAVNVYRRALAGEADGSVVMISVGYLENLSALLNSPADAISPLTGRQLVAAKVKSLNVMGGGYPSRATENNLQGNPAAAQDVTNNWPTKIVWSGYEVGDAVHTGQTISSVHPVNSPVRVAYEHFIPAGNWFYSYDLTAAYHAIRPNDPVLTESAAGNNVIDGNGGNVFTTGSGNEYYLKQTNPDATAAAIEQLLDTLPSVQPPASPTVSASPTTIAPSGSTTVSWANVASPTGSDWVGLYKAGALDTSITSWWYTSTCTQTQGTAKASGSCSVRVPSTTGTYEYRLFKNNTYSRLATSSAITVGSADSTPPGITGVTAGSLSDNGAAISWSTDEAADSQVEYGLTTSYGSTTTLDTTAAQSHSQALSGLTPGTPYHFRVKSRDAAGNLATSGDFTFTTTGTAPDTTGPQITGVSTGSAADTGISVYWNTDEAADSQVEYGLTTSYGSTTTLDATAVQSHSQALSGLTPGTLYHFRVKSTDAAGNPATSGDYTFTTTGVAPGPAISVSPDFVTPAGMVTFSWQGIARPSSTDWIGVYLKGAGNTAAARWYFTATCTQTSGTARASGQCTKPMPTSPGTYELRLFANNTYTKLATSNPVVVTQADLRGGLQAVRAQVFAAQSNSSGDTAKKLGEIVNALDKSVWASWIDGDHPAKGDPVFAPLQDAVTKMLDLGSKGATPSSVSSQLGPWEDTLVQTAHDLAKLAISEWSGDSKKLAAAENELARGDASADSKPQDAIGHYKNAFKQLNG